ncbi:TSUP family transporter [Stenotrophomonas sp. NLF4-10]|uniref:sulfite exporter TauE/SafE family protein n=1 Tax=Stenotrophomonas sp. NLF4-10 TaxID=2918754 RepID=UPI001EFBA063|nr:TSUP family transporter [Stenotrophomonas sp. NLF4-10]MCG8275051.1 TSUP family transporter [Stenotrophomonas sp. NLF4-10]
MLELLPAELPWLIVIAFVAGLVDAAVGGGGLIQLPGLFTTLPQQAPTALLGTNKFSSMFGTGAAAWRYARSVRFPWRPVLLAAAAAFVFSFLGATAVSLLSKGAVRPLVLALLVVMLGYTLAKKDFGALHRPREVGRRELGIALAMGAVIGFYDGFFGPGTGSFLIFLFVRFFGLDFLRASAASKVVNLATNVAALAFFVPSGNVLLVFAVPMAVANIAGSVAGTRMALRGGTPLIRRLFLALVVVLIARMGWDTFGG